MGQDGEDWQSEPPGLDPPQGSQTDVKDELRFERGLALKALISIGLVVTIIVIRQLWLR